MPSPCQQIDPPCIKRSHYYIDYTYRCADGRFWLSARGVTILNSRSVSSSETEARNGIKSRKPCLFSSVEWKEVFGGL